MTPLSGKLYLVATPIGNLGDITYRAVETLKAADLIACEDTRHSKILFERYAIHRPLVSYSGFDEKRRAPQILARLKEGLTVALISDAGTPGVCDPGYRIVRAAIDEGITVEAVPGPSAAMTALSVSGLPTDRFAFEGFVAVKDGARRARLSRCRAEDRTSIFYESPHRLLKTLEAMAELLGDSQVVVARELTKKFEEIYRGTAAQALAHFKAKKVQGEFVLLFHPSVDAEAP